MYSFSHSQMNWMVAVDGSEASHFAYEIVTRGLLKETDRLTVAHVFNKEKTYLPFNMQPETIKQVYETEIIGYGSRAIMLWEELERGITTKEHIT